ncbi:hypothetical protein ACF0H5_021090 [Mactra antiquata]
MSLLSDVNTLRNWNEPFKRARQAVNDEVHLTEECCYHVWNNWRLRPEGYPNFILIRECICETKTDRLREYRGRSSIPLDHFNKDGIEIHIDPDQRCRYHAKHLPNGKLKLEKVCHCPDTKQRIRDLEKHMP